MHFTQKERMLIEDVKSQEQLCIKKYNKYTEQAQDPQLKQLFSSLAQKEQEHFDTLNQMLAGQIPNVQQGQQQQQQQHQQQRFAPLTQNQFNQHDADLCQDMLSTEKYVSQTYDTSIFEFTNPQIRQVLNHIQSEEQQHGEQIFKYMESKGMYQVH
ncbi:MAG: spore coat protein [Desulfitobacteriia bacterium]|jgi:spore coat protein CotF